MFSTDDGPVVWSLTSHQSLHIHCCPFSTPHFIELIFQVFWDYCFVKLLLTYRVTWVLELIKTLDLGVKQAY
jgi:hypothetical protein